MRGRGGAHVHNIALSYDLPHTTMDNVNYSLNQNYYRWFSPYCFATHPLTPSPIDGLVLSISSGRVEICRHTCRSRRVCDCNMCRGYVHMYYTWRDHERHVSSFCRTSCRILQCSFYIIFQRVVYILTKHQAIVANSLFCYPLCLRIPSLHTRPAVRKNTEVILYTDDDHLRMNKRSCLYVCTLPRLRRKIKAQLILFISATHSICIYFFKSKAKIQTHTSRCCQNMT